VVSPDNQGKATDESRKHGPLASQKMQPEAQARGRIGGTPEESGCGAIRELKQTVG